MRCSDALQVTTLAYDLRRKVSVALPGIVCLTDSEER